MKTIFSLILIISVAMSSSAQELNKKVMDAGRQKEILLNNCTRDALVAFPEFKSSYDPNYESYKPDSLTVMNLKQLAEGKKITVVLGTWCGDSKLQVPHFYKVLDQAGINTDKVNIIALDGSKHAENGLIDQLNISRIPTFIFTDQTGKELGRITEHPKTSLEADMKEILQGSK